MGTEIAYSPRASLRIENAGYRGMDGRQGRMRGEKNVNCRSEADSIFYLKGGDKYGPRRQKGGDQMQG